MPTVSIVVPTRERADYLDVALASIAPQAREADAEVQRKAAGASFAGDADPYRHDDEDSDEEPPTVEAEAPIDLQGRSGR